MTDTSLSNESRFIKFSLLLLFGTISIICASYIVYNVIKYPSLRQRFHNQTLIILVFLVLLNTIFNIPSTYSFFARGSVLIESKSFCRAWQILDYIFTSSIIWCRAIFTLERYILVFYSKYLRTQRQKLILHYIPLILINLYIVLFYILVDVFCPKNHLPHFRQHLCGHHCLDHMDHLSLYSWLFNILFPVFIVIFGSAALVLRVLWTRREMQRNLRNWSKNWKMIVQLLGIAIIYAIVWLPVTIISLISKLDDDKSTESIADHFYFLTYLCELTLPVVSLLFWPELMQKIRGHLRSNSAVSVTMGGHSTN